MVGADPEVKNLDIAAVKAGVIKLDHGLYITLGRTGEQWPGADGTWVTVLDPDLKIRDRIFPATAAGCTTFRILGATHDGKGRVAVSGICWGADSDPINKLIFYNLAEKKVERVVPTQPYQCPALDFAPNGDLLCAGLDVPRVKQRDYGYALLYRFDSSGALISQSIRRDSIATTAPIELRTEDGPPGILAWGQNRIALWYPSVPVLIVADRTGAELSRYAFPEKQPESNLAMFAGPSDELCSFIPNLGLNAGSVPRHQVACLVNDDGTPLTPSSVQGEGGMKVRWKFRAQWENVHYPGRSTEFVGFSGASPVLWNRTSSDLITLPSAGGQ